MRDDGGVEKRMRLLRPAGRHTVAANALAASNWADAGEPEWRAPREAGAAALPSRTESRFWLVAGLRDAFGLAGEIALTLSEPQGSAKFRGVNR